MIIRIGRGAAGSDMRGLGPIRRWHLNQERASLRLRDVLQLTSIGSQDGPRDKHAETGGAGLGLERMEEPLGILKHRAVIAEAHDDEAVHSISLQSDALLGDVLQGALEILGEVEK